MWSKNNIAVADGQLVLPWYRRRGSHLTILVVVGCIVTTVLVTAIMGSDDSSGGGDSDSTFAVIATTTFVRSHMIVLVCPCLGEPLTSNMFGKLGAAVGCFGERRRCCAKRFPIDVAEGVVIEMKDFL